MNKLELNGVSKQFGPHYALRQVSVSFEEGHIYGLLGRNGAGKSTLLNLITGKLPQQEGSILLNGEPIWENSHALCQMYCMSEPTYYPDSMRVQDALRWTARFYPHFSMERAQQLCKKFELNTKKKIKALSTGYDSIFKIVVAFSCGAAFLLLDEPVLGLDANARELFYQELLTAYSERPAVYVISTHLIGEIEALIDHAVILHQGEILLDDSVERILSRGYTISGPAAVVDEFCKGKQVIGSNTLGGLKSAAVLGECSSLPAGLEASSLDLQHLFVQLTNSEGEKSA